MVFPETRYIRDIDFHVVVKRPITEYEKERIQNLHEALAHEFPPLGAELDGRYILLEDAQQASPPRLQVFHPDLFDDSWAIHRAHMRAGYCITMHGPPPEQIFPEPTCSELAHGLEVERDYVEKHLTEYPDYCVLNLSRLIYSSQTKHVVVSKNAAADWALEHFADWRHLIRAALRSYAEEEKEEDRRLLESEVERFYQFASNRIKEINTG